MAATTLLTSDQFLALPEEFDQHGNRFKDELIGGEVVKCLHLPAYMTGSRIASTEFWSAILTPMLKATLDTLVEIGSQVERT